MEGAALSAPKFWDATARVPPLVVDRRFETCATLMQSPFSNSSSTYSGSFGASSDETLSLYMSRASDPLASKQGSYSIPLSKLMWRTLRSIEYGFETLASTRILFSLAKAVISARPGNCLRNFSSHQGAITCSPGAGAAAVSSKRTWSFPFPVAPCAIASADSARAISTMCLAMSGRAMLVPRKCCPS